MRSTLRIPRGFPEGRKILMVWERGLDMIGSLIFSSNKQIIFQTGRLKAEIK
ncbi:hypothetical protein l11_08650 [Neisseria weaveri LMG 5135]|nr:hypothetical protein l11_08650 [Neisseria weaveri LMG 5135]